MIIKTKNNKQVNQKLNGGISWIYYSFFNKPVYIKSYFDWWNYMTYQKCPICYNFITQIIYEEIIICPDDPFLPGISIL